MPCRKQKKPCIAGKEERKEVTGVWLRRIIAMMAVLVIASIVRYFLGDICGFAAGIFVCAILMKWTES